MTARPVHVGCSGWVYPDWRGRFYPEKLPQRRWLEHYSGEFGTVEINNTFYRLASEAAVAGWVEHTPPGFVFSVKASRYLTHIKRLKLLDRYLENFYAPLNAMRDAGKLGPILWQLPESFKRDDDRLAAALEMLPEGRHCFEFRHESWFTRPVYDLLGEHGVALVIGDDPTRPFQARERTTDWTFIRFHRSGRRQSGRYTPAELDTWIRRLAQWRRRTEVFAYFNNDWKGYAFENARYLKRGLGV